MCESVNCRLGDCSELKLLLQLPWMCKGKGESEECYTEFFVAWLGCSELFVSLDGDGGLHMFPSNLYCYISSITGIYVRISNGLLLREQSGYSPLLLSFMCDQLRRFLILWQIIFSCKGEHVKKMVNFDIIPFLQIRSH